MASADATPHALLSASGAPRWMNCPGSVALGKGVVARRSEFAEQGTVAHELASAILTNKRFMHPSIDEEMVEAVHSYVKLVKEYTADGTLLVEKRVDYSSYLDVPDSFGTSDAIIVSKDGKTITVVDLKYGRGVRVYAEENEQLMLYALGAINEVEVLGYEIENIRMVIHQPRLEHISEWECSTRKLAAFGRQAREIAQFAMEMYNAENSEEYAKQHLTPGEDQCRFCPAKDKCPAIDAHVAKLIGAQFEDVSDPIHVSAKNLSYKMKAVPLIEDWCKAVRARTESELMAGKTVHGFKLVEGRKGPRSWAAPDEAAEVMKSMRMRDDEIYDMKVISPTAAEKLLKTQPRRWSRLEELVVRKDGVPSVAPVSDRRPPIIVTPALEGFEIEGPTIEGESDVSKT